MTNSDSKPFSQLNACSALAEHYEKVKRLHMRRLFSVSPQRCSQFSIKVNDILLDYSKNRITGETKRLLCDLAREAKLELWREKMFSGEKINNTENRAVLHTALRNRSGNPVMVDGKDIMPEVNAVIQQMGEFAEKVRSGEWLGYTGKQITDVVNIGIGGSDLGPQMVTQALRPYRHERLTLHFISNVDGAHIEEHLKLLDPETTLFIVSSKSFATQETITNARTARKWFLQTANVSSAVAKHFVAVSTNTEAVTRFGIAKENMFVFWSWVGGRYSLWSAIGLSVVIAIGIGRFIEMLEGAHSMDEHFKTAPLEDNMPVILGLLGVWYNNFFGAESHAILPYDHYLRSLPLYLEQADMESNGKGVDRNGKPVDYATGPIIWGATGINGQHAFYQLLHQGTKMIPADFIVSALTHSKYQNQHDIVLSNALAQTEALMRGRNLDETYADVIASGLNADDVKHRVNHMVFEGNHPSNTLLIKKLTPRSLGSLLALYEHKIFVQGIIWNLNSYDQWGVELGKQLAMRILNDIALPYEVRSHDTSTNELINYYKHLVQEAAAEKAKNMAS